MAKITRFDAAAFKSRIEHEINKGNVNETQKLVDQFCEFQEFNEEIKLPEDFIIKLKQEERRKKMMRRNQLCKVIAIAAVVVCFAGGTVYAATNFLQKVRHTEYGLAVGDGRDEQEDKQLNKNLRENRNNVPTVDEVVIDSVDGDANTKWIKKITTESPLVSTDDGINWTVSSENCLRSVSYIYDNFEYALADNLIPKVFTDTLLQKLSLTEDASCGRSENKDDINILNANFLFGESGKVDLDILIGGIHNLEGNVINYNVAGTEKATNHKDYVTKNGVECALCDIVEDGITSTNTILVFGKYKLILKFTDMTEDQIHEFLEELDATVLK